MEWGKELPLWCNGLRIWHCLWGRAGLIPSPMQWVKCPALPCLWYRLQLQLGFLAWEIPNAIVLARKKVRKAGTLEGNRSVCVTMQKADQQPAKSRRNQLPQFPPKVQWSLKFLKWLRILPWHLELTLLCYFLPFYLYTPPSQSLTVHP